MGEIITKISTLYLKNILCRRLFVHNFTTDSARLVEIYLGLIESK